MPGDIRAYDALLDIEHIIQELGINRPRSFPTHGYRLIASTLCPSRLNIEEPIISGHIQCGLVSRQFPEFNSGRRYIGRVEIIGLGKCIVIRFIGTVNKQCTSCRKIGHAQTSDETHKTRFLSYGKTAVFTKVLVPEIETYAVTALIRNNSICHTHVGIVIGFIDICILR